MITRAIRPLCSSCRIRFDHTSTFIGTRWSGFAALQRRSTVPTQVPQDESLHYSERQLKSIYNDLFSSLPSAAQPTWDEPKEDSAQTLQTLQERFGLRDSSHRTIINHMQVATELAPGIDLQLGLVLDTEWEHIIIGAVCNTMPV
ncbi:hypothetical protein AG1IA_07225 [Rhizoctonia solani AG-1 IA]|uniref:Uncharacterized protein n=1 Tax=Thanatephorus cucumeris (strain AG1-IA) TaxID=983506 RepID=L8WPP3_THACA|nr:hypothetical protein AG1IA_07225 [Rhizoctonia solani AG-1 IA]